MRPLTLILAALAALAGSAAAHEMRPSLLELEPGDGGRVAVQFRIGYAKGAPMPLAARLPGHCTAGPQTVRDAEPVRTVRWTADCGAAGLSGTLAIDGLARTGTDVIVRGPHGTTVLRPDSPSMTLGQPAAGAGETLSAYVRIGVEHIWLGPDHLLFVLGLVLLVGARARPLLGTITAFTVAHSVTLVLATLGVVDLPTRAVEAVIAASIVVLAAELVRPTAPTWASRAPWVFAFVCGLLHGFGFAGVLGEVGLPASAVPAALLGFNVGVELGQLAFVGVVLAVGAAATRVRLPGGRLAVVYGMGAIGAFWVWERTLPILQDWGLR